MVEPIIADAPSDGRWTSESARAAVQKRWDREKARASGSEGDTKEGTEASGDGAIARAALLRIVGAKGSQDAAVVSAARTLLEQAGALAVDKPRTTTQLEGMSDPELDGLLRRLEVAHSLPYIDDVSVQADEATPPS